MARIYGYWDDELNTFVPSGGAPQQQGAMPIGGNQGSYGVPYNNAPRYNQRFYGPGYAPTNVAVGFNNGSRVRYNYQPRYTGNGYAPRGYNTNMNYGPWYGQQSYAAYPPYAPYQPRYEWMPGSNGQPVAVRLGEYQREQPVAYETMFNSQGVPVQVPVYAPMNNSAMPVRVGVSPDGQPYGNVNYQAAFPQQRQQQRNATRVRNMPSPVPVRGYNIDNPGNTGHAFSGNTDLEDEQAIQYTTQALTSSSNVPTISSASTEVLGSVPTENAISLQNSREAMIQTEFEKRKANQQILIDQGTLASTPLSDEEIMAQATVAVDKKILSANRTR